MHLPPRFSRVDIERFLRFAMVGGAGFLIDAGLLFVLHHRAGLDPFLARSISLPVAAFSTWRLNRRVTFMGSGRLDAARRRKDSATPWSRH
jgi:putative flippase GtrA